MRLYARHIGPRLVACLCSQAAVAREREKIVPLASGVVLEIGIGPGLNLSLYDPARVERVIGVDPHDGFTSLGAARFGGGAIPVEVIRAPAEALPLPDASIDTAVITYTLCSVDDPARALAEVRRVLRPGGRVLFLEHGLADQPGVARWQQRLNPVWRRVAVGCNLTRPVQRLLEHAGFRIEEVERYFVEGFPRPVGFHCRGVATAAA